MSPVWNDLKQHGVYRHIHMPTFLPSIYPPYFMHGLFELKVNADANPDARHKDGRNIRHLWDSLSVNRKDNGMKKTMILLLFGLLLVPVVSFAQNCRPDGLGGWRCSSGTTASPDGLGGWRYNDGSSSRPDGLGGWRHSTGTTTHPDGLGGWRNSNGTNCRPDGLGGFRCN